MKTPTIEILLKDFVRWWTTAVWFALVVTVFAIANAAFSPMGNVDTGDVLSKDVWNQMVANFEDLNARVGTASSVPSGAVMAFNLSACPTGWSEYAPAYGRFIRGIDKSGTNIDPSGQRTAWNVQWDAFQWHIHPLSGLKNAVLWGWSTHWNNAPGYTDTWSTQLIWSPANDWTNGVPRTANETRPKNVALLYCVKN